MDPKHLWIDIVDLGKKKEDLAPGTYLETDMGRVLVQTKTWFCGKCHRACVDLDHAKRCCACSECGEYLGEEVGAIHRECYDKAQKKREQDRWDKKKLVSPDEVDWNERVLSIEWSYVIEDPEEALEIYLDDQHPTPIKDLLDTEIVLMKKDPWKDVYIEPILERVDEEYFEEASEHLHGVEELEQAFRVFNEINREKFSAWIECDEKVRVRDLVAWLGKTDWLEGKWNGEEEERGGETESNPGE